MRMFRGCFQLSKWQPCLTSTLTKSSVQLCFSCGKKDSIQRMVIKKYLLFTVGNACGVKRFTAGSRIALKEFRKSHMMKRRCRSGWDKSPKIFCCGFRHTGKAMGQAYQCWWRACREINVFLQVRISHALRFISICAVFTDSPSYIHLRCMLS
jgi:hypothetical protein